MQGKEFKSVNDAADFYHLPRQCVHKRLRAGWSIKESFGLKERSDTCVGVVYLITNSVNEKVYVGITTGKLQDRFVSHKGFARKKVNIPLYIAINSIGADKFNIEVLVTTKSRAKLRLLEEKYIALYDSVDTGYNTLYTGGNLGNKHGRRLKYKGQIYSSLKELSLDLNMTYWKTCDKVNSGKIKVTYLQWELK